MADIFFIAIAFYIVYKLFTDFIMPVYKTTTHVKNQFRNMRDNTGQENFTKQEQKTGNGQDHKKAKMGEYIDFEEVKK